MKNRRRLSRAAAILVAGLVGAAPTVAATITVNTLSDASLADGFCSFREAVNSVGNNVETNECPAGSAEDIIEFSVTGTILLSSPLGAIFEAVDLRGPGSADLTIDGADLYRPIALGNRVKTPPQVHRISGVTLRRGLATSGGGLSIGSGHRVTLEDVVIEDSHATGVGGGVFISYNAELGPADVTFDRCTISDNHSDSSGGGLAVQGGGGEVTIRASAIVNNDASNDGGGIYARNDQVYKIERSTFSGNTAGLDGGGIWNGGADVSVFDSTLTDNTADFDGDDDGIAGGIGASGGSTVTLGNTIVAGNHDLSPTEKSPDVDGIFSSLGYNVIGDNSEAAASFPEGAPNGFLDTVGTAASPIDPRLGTLADNGGGTLSHAPLIELGSPLIDQGSCAGVLRDQRGYGNALTYRRIFDTELVVNADDGCDIGAIELGTDPIPFDTLFLSGFESGDTLYWSESVGV